MANRVTAEIHLGTLGSSISSTVVNCHGDDAQLHRVNPVRARSEAALLTIRSHLLTLHEECCQQRSSKS